MTAPAPASGLVCGDCAKVMEGMPEGSIDLIVTSPPYDNIRNYNGYAFDFDGTAKQMYRVLKEGRIAVWIIADKTRNGNLSLESFRQGLHFQEIGFNMYDIIIYHKKNPPFQNRTRYPKAFEYMFVLSKGMPTVFNQIMVSGMEYAKGRRNNAVSIRNRNGNMMHSEPTCKPLKSISNVWSYDIGYNMSSKDKIAFKHPAIFPEKLAEDHILSWSNPGDLVLDPFCGSGTTLKMAAKHRRRWMGIDVSPEYIDIARRRVDIYAAQGRLTAVP